MMLPQHTIKSGMLCLAPRFPRKFLVSIHFLRVMQQGSSSYLSISAVVDCNIYAYYIMKFCSALVMLLFSSMTLLSHHR